MEIVSGDRHLSILVIHRGDLIDEMFYERLENKFYRRETGKDGSERGRKREREREGGGYARVNLIM